MNIHIETERFILRDIRDEDEEGMFLLDSDPEVHEYLGKKPIKTLDEARGIIRYIQKQYEDHGMGRLAIIDKKTNDFIGWTGIKYEQEVRDYGYYDVGYRLRKEYWGMGIATETAVASLKYGFEELNLDEICGGAEIENIGSNKVLQKIGLKQLETFEFDNEPHYWYRITKEEWFAMQ